MRRRSHGADTHRAGSHLVALFVVYLALLVWTVLWKLQDPWLGDVTTIKLVPFVASGGAGASAPLEVIVNLVLFMPFGLYLGLLAPGRPWWRHAVTLAGASLALEVAQYVLAVGRSDATDVIVNTGGGLAGLGLLVLTRHGFEARTAGLVTRACSIGTVLALLGTGLYLASPERILSLRDVGPLARTDTSGHRAPAVPSSVIPR